MRTTRQLFFALLWIVGLPVSAQQFTVEGSIVSNRTKVPIEGAFISVKGSTAHTFSDWEGMFQLTGLSAEDTLVISYIGMDSRKLAAKPRLHVEMTDKGHTLDEVVVVAYGETQKRSVTGAMEVVDSRQMEKAHVSNLLAVLDGVAGLEVYDSNGQPGRDGNIYMRGFTSIHGNNAPLYVVDGAEFTGSVYDINVQDIENISVLKDAAGAALYGNRAANGVILITLKTGKNTRPGLNFSMRQGMVVRGLNEYEKTGADAFMEANWQAYYNSLITAGATAENAANTASTGLVNTYLKYNIYNLPAEQLFDSNGKLVQGAKVLDGYKGDTDWLDALTRIGHRQEYTLSDSYRSERSTRYLSIGYLREEGYVKNSDFSRLSGRAAMTFTPNHWLHGGLSLTAGYQESDLMAQTTGTQDNVINFARMVAPIYPVHKHDAKTGAYLLNYAGELIYDDSNERPFLPGRNAIWESEVDKKEFTRTTLNARPYIELSLPYGLKASVNATLDYANQHTNYAYSALVGTGFPNGMASRYTQQWKGYTLNEQLSWTHNWLHIHHVDIMAAHENFERNEELSYGSMSDESFPGNGHFANYSVITSLRSYSVIARSESYLARARYNYNHLYYLEASLRRDGSSRFSKNNRWGNFYSIGGAWILSDEKWFRKRAGRVVNNLKIRMNYGEMGNDRSVGDYAFNTLYLSTYNAGQGATFKAQKASKDLKWETIASLNLGADMRLWNRLNIGFNFFDKQSKDLIFYEQTPLSSGATDTEIYESGPTRAINLGKVSNAGIEISADMDLIHTRNWRWNMGTTFTHVRNKVKTLPERNRVEGIVDGNQKIAEGKSLYTWWLPQYAGVNGKNGHALYLLDTDRYYLVGIQEPSEGKTGIPESSQNGIVHIDGTYYTEIPGSAYVKYDYSGSALPDFYGSIHTTLTWRSLSLRILGIYSVGGKIYDASYQSLVSSAGTSITALHKDVQNAWTSADASEQDALLTGKLPAMNYTQSPMNNANSTRFLKSGSYFVMRRISLDYDLPTAWVRPCGLEGITVQFVTENLFTVTSRKGLNPRQGVEGVSSNVSVNPRIFSLGINFKM